MTRILTVLLVGLVVAAGSAGALANVLVNPGFEEPPYGDFVDPDYYPTGWTAAPQQWWQQWQGVYDSTWKNPPCDPIWPHPVHEPVDGNYFLAHWFPPQDITETACEYDNDHTGGRSSYIYQTVTGLTPGETYYFSAWLATNHPHGGGAGLRLVCLPQEYDEVLETFTPELDPVNPITTPGYTAAPADTLYDPGPPPVYERHFEGSDEEWGKLTGEVTLGPNQNAATLFVQYVMTTNNISEPQYVQVDHVRLATTQELEICNVELKNFTETSVDLEWDVRDGDNMVTGIGSLNCRVLYGLTDSYGQQRGALELDPIICDSDRHGHPGHYSVTIPSLTPGATYHFKIQVDAGDYTWVGPYNCPGPPANPDPETGTRSYASAETADATFDMLPLMDITNIQVTGITANSATITWDTSYGGSPLAADSLVEYGRFGRLEDSEYDSALVTSHSVTLTGLEGSTTYTYKITSSAPGYNPTSSNELTFQTTLGPDIMNGDFEINAHQNNIPPYWYKPQLAGGLALSPTEWSIAPQHGQWKCGRIVNASGALEKLGLYQQIATTPGQVVSLYAWSYATGQAAGDPEDPVGLVHRFGENNNQIGISPTGALPSLFQTWPADIRWSEQLGSMRFAEYWASDHMSNYGTWRRLGICTIAQSDKVTLYLRTRGWYAVGWVMNFFDNVYLEPPVEIHSVSELKSLATAADAVPGDMFQTNVNLTQGDFVITYVSAPNPDPHDNRGEPYMYIQDVDTGVGIKVTFGPDIDTSGWDQDPPAWLTEGYKVNILGTLDWGYLWNYTHEGDTYQGSHFAQQLRMDNPSGEPVLRAVQITPVDQGTMPTPMGVTNLALGGGSSSDPWISIPGVVNETPCADGSCCKWASGPNNVGSLVRIWGKIVEIGNVAGPFTDVYIVIDDGSNLPLPDQSQPKPSLCPQSVPGIYINTREIFPPMLDDQSREIQVGDYAIIDGISSVRLELDWEDLNGWPDPNDPNIIIPEAMKNARMIRPTNMQFFALD